MTHTLIDQRQLAAREARVRRMLRSEGLVLRKSRRRVEPTIDNLGEYAVLDPSINAIVLGARFEHSLDDIEAYYAPSARGVA